MNTFLGMELSQNWYDFPIWEEFFRQYPIRTFIELGTGHGGMTTYFALQCAHRGIHFHTFDHQTWFDFSKGIPLLLDIQGKFHFFDLFSPSGTSAVADIIVTYPKPLAIFFDNGNKPREWKIFAPLTGPGDFCIVHDWGVEFKQEDIAEVPVQPILTAQFDARPGGWKTRWFVRT